MRARGRGRARALAVVLLLAVSQLAAVAWPAYACGCGAMVTGDEAQLTVTRETSVLRWDGATQDIVMQLSVAGDAPEAAWIMPVPDRAEVSLGDRALFEDLRRMTGPEYRTRHYFWPREGDWPRSADGGGDAAGGAPQDGAPPGVEVVGRERLGPFEVARLAATDPEALDEWLGDHGFDLPDRLAEELAPYVAAGWEYVAIRLAPGAEDGTADGSGEAAVLGGDLDPLRLTFASDTLVYPMRLSRLAEQEQRLRLYVLADHRMEPAGDIGGAAPEVAFAGRVAADELPAGPVRELVADATGTGTRSGAPDGERFLTVLDQSFPQPERISGDHRLVPAAEDAEYREVIYRDELLTWGGVPAWLVTVGGAGLLLTVVSVVVARRRMAADPGRVFTVPPLPPAPPAPRR